MQLLFLLFNTYFNRNLLLTDTRIFYNFIFMFLFVQIRCCCKYLIVVINVIIL